MLVAESAAAASLHVDVAGVSFATAEGVTPARLVRLAHGVARSVLLAMMEQKAGGGGREEDEGGEDDEEEEAAKKKQMRAQQLEASLAALDSKFDLAHAHLGREALDAAVCLDASARVDRERLGGALVLRVRGLPSNSSGGSGGSGSSCSAGDDNASGQLQQQQPPPPPPPPLLAVNDLELMTLFGARPPGPEDADDEAMAA